MFKKFTCWLLAILMVLSICIVPAAAETTTLPGTGSAKGKTVTLSVTPRTQKIPRSTEDTYVTFDITITPPERRKIAAFSFALAEPTGMTLAAPEGSWWKLNSATLAKHYAQVSFSANYTRYFGAGGSINGGISEATRVMSVTVKIPANTVPGEYYLRVVTEGDEIDIFTAGLKNGDQYNREVIYTPVTVVAETGMHGRIQGAGDESVTYALYQEGNSEPVLQGSAIDEFFWFGVSDGTYRLEISGGNIVTRSFDITVSGQSISSEDIRVAQYGDVNGTGDIDISDMACLYDYLTTNENSGALSGDYLEEVADLNGDDAVDVYDLQFLYEVVSGIRGDIDNTPAAGGSTIYVMGPTPDHGWTAQAGVYAQAKCDKINAAGEYKAVYMSASSGEEQVDQINTIIANGDAAIVVMMALDDSAQVGQKALYAEKIPFISFDRIIEATEACAMLNASGDNWQCGRGIAYWLQQNGMKPGDTIVTMYGDNGTVCSRRADGFKEFLTGAEKYSDKALGQDFETTEVWDEAAADAALNIFATVCDWSADNAYDYLEQNMKEIVAFAKKNGGKLYIFSMDDEMTFGIMNFLETAPYAMKADLKKLDVYIAAIGGMQELYDVMADTTETTIANIYFDDMMSMYFSPKMMQDVIDKAIQYLSGNWTYEVGAREYLPTWIVGRDNVNEYEGFKGHV